MRKKEKFIESRYEKKMITKMELEIEIEIEMERGEKSGTHCLRINNNKSNFSSSLKITLPKL